MGSDDGANHFCEAVIFGSWSMSKKNTRSSGRCSVDDLICSPFSVKDRGRTPNAGGGKVKEITIS